jgi:hypothetical protein
MQARRVHSHGAPEARKISTLHAAVQGCVAIRNPAGGTSRQSPPAAQAPAVARDPHQ